MSLKLLLKVQFLSIQIKMCEKEIVGDMLNNVFIIIKQLNINKN